MTCLRVGFDQTPAAVGLTGVVRLSERLADQLEARPDIELVRFSLGRRRRAVTGRHVPIPLRVVHPLWSLLGEPRAERFTGAVDVVHSTDLVPPPSRAPLVVTVHDLLPLTNPEWYSDRARADHAAKLAALRAPAV